MKTKATEIRLAGFRLVHNRNTARPCIRVREIYKTNNLAKAVDVHADRYPGSVSLSKGATRGELQKWVWRPGNDRYIECVITGAHAGRHPQIRPCIGQKRENL